MMKALPVFLIGLAIAGAAIHLSSHGILDGAIVALIIGGGLMLASLFMAVK